MGVRTKTLLTVILVGVIVGAFALTTQNENLFKGQIFNGSDAELDVEPTEDTALPDLKPTMELLAPETPEADISVVATIENIGEGAIQGGQPFKYAIYINDIEVLSNSDSYSALEPGDSFSFTYPISKTIYQYPEQGEISFVLDTEESIKESNEENNKATESYSL